MAALLPDGSSLKPPAGPEGAPAIQEADFDGDGRAEVIATYATKDSGYGYVIVRRSLTNRGNWEKVQAEQRPLTPVDRAQIADVTGDGRPDLLVGWSIGASVGSELDLLTWQDKTMPDIAGTAYHRLEVGDFSGRWGVDGKAEVALWQKDTGDAFRVEVLRWTDGGLVPAEDVYGAYFPRVVDYYLERVRQHPEVPVYWYYLADAQLKAGKPVDALDSVTRGLALGGTSTYPSRNEFLLVQAQALYGSGDSAKAEQALTELASVFSAEGSAYAKRNLARACLTLGHLLADTGRKAEAERAWQSGLQAVGGPGGVGPGRYADTASFLKAVAELKAAEGAEAIRRYVAECGPPPSPSASAWSATIADITQWAAGQGLAVNVAVAEDPQAALAGTLLVDFSVDLSRGSDTYDGHLVFWWTGQELHHQCFFSAAADEHGLPLTYAVLSARVWPSGAGPAQAHVEIGVVYDTCSGGSGSPDPAFRLFRSDGCLWKTVWTSPSCSWLSGHGRVSFGAGDLSRLLVQGDSWMRDDVKNRLFQESNPGPHRRFRSLWTREGDAYRLEEQMVVPSAYATLVEFVYALSTGDREGASLLAASASLVDRALALGLVQDPLGQEWLIDLVSPETEQRGPLKIVSGSAAGVLLGFEEREGQYLVSSLEK